MNLDLRAISALAKHSYESGVEYGGSVDINKKPGIIEMLPTNIVQGEKDAVMIPNGEITFHTHPRECPSLDNCSLVPPSATDMRIFFESSQHENLLQIVASRDFIYFVKCNIKVINNRNIPEIGQLVFDYFSNIEEFFDTDPDIKPRMYHDLFASACRLCGWFTIYRFDHKKGG